MVYLCTYFIFIYFIFIENKNKIAPIFFKLAILYLVLIAALRLEVGNDWYSYIEFYKNLNLANQLIEVGYIFLNNIFSSNQIPYPFFLLVINFISLFFAYKFITQNCKLQFLALLIYISDSYFHFNLSGVRQAIALGLCCFSIKYALNRSPKNFFFLILLSASFHITALIAVIYYFIPKRTLLNEFKIFTIKTIYVIIFISILMLYYEEIILLITTIEFRNKIGLKLAIYLSQDLNLDYNYIKGMLRRIIPLVLFYYYFPAAKRMDNIYYFLNLYVFGLIVYLTTYIISPDIATRISIYFLIFECVIVSNIIFFCKNNFYRYFLMLIYIALVGYKFLDIIGRPEYQYNLNW